MPVLPAATLEQFSTQLLAVGGANAEEARVVGKSLVVSNLNGYESHGVMRIPSYVDMIAKGTIVSGAALTVLHESPSHLAADANWGFGQIQAERLTKRLIEKAAEVGTGTGTLRCSGHIGRLGDYCELVAAHGMVSLMMVNSHGAAVRVAPPGGKAPRLSTNPLAIGVPFRDTPLILDFSTSATAEGKVRVKKIAGQPCPEGWLLDCEGRPTTDPNVLYQKPPGSILPMGGSQSYKGYGLGLMVEILCGALAGGCCAHEPLFTKLGNCVFMLVLNPAKFGGSEVFTREVEALIDYQKSCPLVEGAKEIVMPGDPERKTMRERLANGIFLDPENWAQLVKLADQYKVPVPAVG